MRQRGASKRGVGEDIWGGGIDFIPCFCSYFFAQIRKIHYICIVENKYYNYG